MKNIEILKKANIDVDKGIELLGDIEMYDETLQDFLDESNYLGFTKLAELSLAHQLKSQDNDIKYVKSHYEELMKETSRIIEVVEQYLNS